MIEKEKGILFYVDKINKDGGLSKIVSILENELNNNFRTTVLTNYNIGNLNNIEGNYTSLGGKYVENSEFKKVLLLFSRAFKIIKICRKNNLCIIISFGDHLNLSAILARILSFGKIKVICSSHGNIFNLYNSILFRILIGFFYRFSNKVICISNTQKYYFKKLWNFQNLELIYNPINTKIYKEKILEKVDKNDKYIFNNDNNILITVGRLDNLKGFSRMFRIIAGLYKINKNIKLIVIGDGPLFSKLEKFKNNLGMNGIIILLGRKENIFPYLKKSDLFLFTSITEGLPTVLLESIFAKIPFLSGDCKTGPREILNKKFNNFDEKILYPYINNSGILLKSFSKEIFYTLREKENTILEKQYIETVIKILERKITFDLNKGISRIDDFDKQKVVKKWNKKIKEI